MATIYKTFQGGESAQEELPGSQAVGSLMIVCTSMRYQCSTYCFQRNVFKSPLINFSSWTKGFSKNKNSQTSVQKSETERYVRKNEWGSHFIID